MWNVIKTIITWIKSKSILKLRRYFFGGTAALFFSMFGTHQHPKDFTVCHRRNPQLTSPFRTMLLCQHAMWPSLPGHLLLTNIWVLYGLSRHYLLIEGHNLQKRNDDTNKTAPVMHNHHLKNCDELGCFIQASPMAVCIVGFAHIMYCNQFQPILTKLVFVYVDHGSQ